MPPNPPDHTLRYQTYILRVWREAGTDTGWRCSLEDPHTGSRSGFSDFSTFVRFLKSRAHTQETHMPPQRLPPVIVAAAAGERHSALGHSLLVKTSGAQTDGQWLILQSTIPARSPGPPSHLHKLATEIFVVLEGEMTFTLGDQTRTVGAGGLAYIPPGILHTFANESDAPVTYLGMATPATLEGYFLEVVARVRSGHWPPRDPDEIQQLMEEYDTYSG
jgi:mannose-6-phosphate isomerase-like protein (cupin superfamily)